MVRPAARPESGHVLKWDVPTPWCGVIEIEIQQVDVTTWRADERFRRPVWHVLAGRREGELIACKLKLVGRR
jgi:hypothetical protein